MANNVWNNVQLNGHLWNGKLTTTQRGTSFFQGSLSVYDGKDGDNAKYQKIFLKAFGKNADALSKEKDGAEVNVEGQLKTDVYEKNGEKRYFVYVLVQNYGEDHDQQTASTSSPYGQQRNTQQRRDPVQQEFSDILAPQDDDDLPF